MISVIIPVYNNEKDLEKTHSKLVEVLSLFKEPYEIIAVDDGSTDGSRKKLSSLSPITAVMLSKHFGHNAAMDAGFQKAIGDLIITLSGDLDYELSDITLLVDKLKDGYGVAVGWREGRTISFSRNIFSKLANWLIGKATGIKLHDFNCGLKGYRREFIDGVQLLGENSMFMPVFACDRGAKVAEVKVIYKTEGKEALRYKPKDVLFTFFDLLSVKFLLNYFAKPLRFFGSWALFFLFLSFLSFITFLLIKFQYIISFNPYSFLLIGAVLTILSFLIFILGFITEILLRVYYINRDASQYMIYEIIKNK